MELESFGGVNGTFIKEEEAIHSDTADVELRDVGDEKEEDSRVVDAREAVIVPNMRQLGHRGGAYLMCRMPMRRAMTGRRVEQGFMAGLLFEWKKEEVERPAHRCRAPR